MESVSMKLGILCFMYGDASVGATDSRKEWNHRKKRDD